VLALEKIRLPLRGLEQWQKFFADVLELDVELGDAGEFILQLAELRLCFYESETSVTEFFFALTEVEAEEVAARWQFFNFRQHHEFTWNEEQRSFTGPGKTRCILTSSQNILRRENPSISVRNC